MPFTLPDYRCHPKHGDLGFGILECASYQDYDTIQAANEFNEYCYKKLTHRQRVFVNAYLAHDFNETAAASAAGYGAHEAPRVGKALRRNSKVKQALDLALRYYTEKSRVRYDHLISELKIMALTNITDLIDPYSVTVRDDLDEDDPRWRAIKKISRSETKYGTNIAVEMHDKMSAVDKLLKLLSPPKAQDPDDAAGSGGTNVSVVTNNVNILPVPSGSFLPPPPSPYAATMQIEHEIDPATILQVEADAPSRAVAPA